MAEVMNIINERASIRGYKDEMLSDELIRTLAEAGLQAPTARNEQEIHITVVKKGSPILAELQADLNPKAVKTFYYDAPVVYFLSASDTFKWSPVDAGIAVENMHLAAASLGLGSLIIGCVEGILNGEKKAHYDELLKIPAGYSYEIALAAGYAAVTKEPHTFDYDQHVDLL